MNSGLQVYNEQQKLAEWAEKVKLCRSSGLNVRQWCQENNITVSNYYKWQRKIYALAKTEQEPQFAEVTPVMTDHGTAPVAITVHVAGVSADIHNGADPATVEAVFRILKLC